MIGLSKTRRKEAEVRVSDAVDFDVRSVVCRVEPDTRPPWIGSKKRSDPLGSPRFKCLRFSLVKDSDGARPAWRPAAYLVSGNLFTVSPFAFTTATEMAPLPSRQ